MTWRTSLSTASFRGVEFYVNQHDAAGGRRIASHEYPQRDEPYTQDLGRKQRKYNLDAFILGQNYHLARNQLVNALEEAGPGLLVHPYLGQLNLVVESYSLQESTAKGGLASFKLVFLESGQQPAPGNLNTQQALAEKSQSFTEKLIAKTAQGLHLAKQPARVINAAFNKLQQVENFLNEASGTLVQLANTPKDLAQRLVNAAANLVVLSNTTLSGLNNAGKLSPSWPLASSPAAYTINQNDYAISLALAGSGLAAAALQISQQEPFASQQQANEFLHAFTASTNALLTSQTPALNLPAGQTPPPSLQAALTPQPLDDDLYLSLKEVHTALVEDLQARSLHNERLTKLVLNQPTPSLVVTYNHYESLTQQASFLARNNLKHPAFVQGQVQLVTLDVKP